MSSWSKRRKYEYGAIVAIIVVGVVILLFYRFIYKTPTCFDGVQNQSEQGVDCGGVCERLCSNSFLAADIAWSRLEEVAPGLYNIAAYVINNNVEGGAASVPYHIVLYDNQGMLITETDGLVTLPPHRNTLIFAPAVPVGKRIPVRASVEFTSEPDWRKQKDTLQSLVVSNKKYSEDETGSSLMVTLRNTSVTTIENLTVYAVLYDRNGNAIGFSKTQLDEVPALGDAVAPFTWPINRHDMVISIEVLPVAE